MRPGQKSGDMPVIPEHQTARVSKIMWVDTMLFQASKREHLNHKKK